MEIENSSLQEFGTKPGSFSEIKRKVLAWSAIILIPSVAIGLWAGMGDSNGSTVKSVLLIVIPILVVFVSINLFLTLRRQKKLFESFRITITKDSIIREQLNTPVIMVRKEEIKEITKTKSGVICVKGKQAANCIFIYAQMQNYEELEQALNAVSPLVPEKKMTKWVLLIFSVILLVAGLFYILNTSKNKFLVLISGLGLTAFFVTSMVMTQQSRQLDQQTKNRSWVVLVLILFVLVSMVMKLNAK